MKVVLIGATGATGQALVPLLLANEAISTVVILVRKKTDWQHPKLQCIEVDFAQLDNYSSYINGDVAISCLGTTLKAAGSKAAQYEVDFNYQFHFAQIAKANNIPTFILVSAAGANANSLLFYSRIKGELEAAITALGFESSLYCRPGPLLRPNTDRTAEKISVAVMQVFNKIGLLKNMTPIAVKDLAKIMIQFGLDAPKGLNILEAAQLLKLIKAL